MAANDTSMSVLGQFYDALIEASKDQGKKYGPSAAPDFVVGSVSDSIAAGLTQIGAMIGSNPAAAQSISDNFTNYAFDKATIGKLNLNQLSPVNVGNFVPTVSYDLGSPLGDTTPDKTVQGSSSAAYGAELKIEYGNPNDLLNNPRAPIEKAVDAYKQSLAKIRQAKLIAGVGAYLQEAANYAILRNENIPDDVAATIVNSRVLTPQVGGEMVRTETPNPIRGLPENIAESKVNTPRVNAASVGTVDSVMASSLAMFAGITDPAARAEFAAHMQTRLMPDVTADHNTRVPTAGASNFYDLFAPIDSNNNKNAIANMRQSELFNPALGGNSTGDLLQASMMNVLQQHAGDASLSPRLRNNLQQMHAQIMDDSQAFSLFNGMGRALDKGTFSVPGATPRPMDLGPVVQLGVNNLATQMQAVGNSRLASSLSGAAGRVGALDGKLTASEQVSYIANRWNTMPAMDKWLTPAMLVMGDAGGFSGLINGLGGLTGTGPLTGKDGISFLQLFGKNADKFKLDDSNGDNSNPLLKWAYGKQKPVTDANKNPVYERDAAGNLVINPNTGKPNQLVKDDYGGSVPQWGKINFTVSSNSNVMQKAAYIGYVAHPVNIVKGALNGSLPQHALWIASGFGKTFERKEFGRMFKSDNFGNLLSKPNAPGARGRINALKNSMEARYRATGDKDFLRAKRVISIMERMNSPVYKGVVHTWETFHKYAGLPGQIQKKAMELAKRAALKAAQWVAVKLGAQVALQAVLAFFTAGASFLASSTYAILNTVTFGALDSVVFGTLKLSLELLVGIILGVIAAIVLFGGIFVVTAQTLIVGGFLIGGGGSWAPDPNYSPVLAYDTTGGDLTPPDGYPFPPGECSSYKGLKCPFTFTSGVYCSQGPFGNGSHACAPDAGSDPYQNRYGVDISGPTQLLAPENGNIVYIEPNETCGGDPNGAYIIFQGSQSGTRYVFAHLALAGKAAGHSGSVSIAVAQGEKMGGAAPLSSYCAAKGGCSCWHHQHIHAYIQGTTASDVIFGLMCGGSVIKCSLNCTSDCKTCGSNVVPSMPAVCSPEDGSGGGGGGTGGGSCKGYTSGVAGNYTQDELASGNIGAGTCNNSLPDSQFSVPGVDKEKFVQVAESSRIWQIASEVPPGSGKTPNLARECYNYVVCKARKSGINPAFALSLWMHESAASNYTFFGIGKRDEDMGIHCYKGANAAEVCACGTTAANNLKAQVEMFNSLTHYDCGRGLEGWASQYGKGTCNSSYGVGYVKDLKLEWSWFASASSFPTWTKDVSKAEPNLNCDAAWVPRP